MRSKKTLCKNTAYDAPTLIVCIFFCHTYRDQTFSVWKTSETRTPRKSQKRRGLPIGVVLGTHSAIFEKIVVLRSLPPVTMVFLLCQSPMNQKLRNIVEDTLFCTPSDNQKFSKITRKKMLLPHNTRYRRPAAQKRGRGVGGLGGTPGPDTGSIFSNLDLKTQPQLFFICEKSLEGSIRGEIQYTFFLINLQCPPQ